MTEKKLPETKLPETKECPKCGGEMVLRTRKADGGKFYACQNQDCRTFENVDKYAPAKKTSTGFYTNKEKASSLTTETSDIITEIKKIYDEVVAQFANDYPEIVGNPATLQALSSTVYIEKNKRLRK